MTPLSARRIGAALIAVSALAVFATMVKLFNWAWGLG